MGHSASRWASYDDYRPDMSIIASHPHSPFPSGITAGLAQDPPSAVALQTLSDFVGGLFYVQISTRYYLALWIGNIVLILVVIGGTGVCIHRYRQRKLWFLRFERRARGLYIVPNALNSFLLCEMSFCTAWILYVAGMYLAYVKRSRWASSQLEAFSLFLWYSLYLGVLCAAVGSFFSVPGVLDGGSDSAPSIFHKVMRRPFVINTISVGLPVLLTGFLAPICALAQVDRTRHWNHYRDFASRIRTTVAVDSLTADVARSYLTEASNLWSESSTNRWTSAGWAGWAIFYGTLLVFYLITGGYMLVVVKRQVVAAKGLVDKQEEHQRHLVLKSQPKEALLFQALQPSQSSTVPATVPRLDRDGPAAPEDTSASPSTQTSSPSTLCSTLQNEKKAVAMEVDIEAQAAVTAALLANGTTASSRAEHHSSFLPRISSIARRRSSQTQRDSGQMLRWRYLRRCYQSLMLMYFGIAAVVTVSVGTASWTSASFTSAWLQGPEQVAYLTGVFALVVTFARVIFGTLTLGAVCFRFFDHPEGKFASAAQGARMDSSPAYEGRPAASAAAARPESLPTGVSEQSPSTREKSAPIDPLRSRLASVPEASASRRVNFGGAEADQACDQAGVQFELALPTASSHGILMTPAPMASYETEEGMGSSSAAAPHASRHFLTSVRGASLRRTSISGDDFATSSFPQDVTRGTIEEDDELLLPCRPVSQPVFSQTAPPPHAILDRHRQRSSVSGPAGPAPNRALPIPLQRFGGSRRQSSTASSGGSSINQTQRGLSGILTALPRRANAVPASLAPSTAPLGALDGSRCRSLEGAVLAPDVAPTPSTLPLDTKAWLSTLNEVLPREPKPTLATATSPPISLASTTFFRPGWNGFARDGGGLSPPPRKQPVTHALTPVPPARRQSVPRSASLRTRDPSTGRPTNSRHSPDREGSEGRKASAAEARRGSRSSRDPAPSISSPSISSSAAKAEAAGMERTSTPLESPVDCDQYQPMMESPGEQLGDPDKVSFRL